MNQFGGCEKLASQYRTTANALLEIEHKSRNFSSLTPSSLKSFRQSLVMIPVEVLESYRDDLLNLEVSAESLFLKENVNGNRIAIFSLVGLVAAVVCGVYAASTGATFFLSLALTVCLASPFAVLWHFSPRETTIRRMRFAQILTHEIAKRRGGGGKKGTVLGGEFGIVQGAFGA